MPPRGISVTMNKSHKEDHVKIDETHSRIGIVAICVALLVGAIILGIVVTPFALFALICLAMAAAMLWMMRSHGH
jgi:fatty acid desaturase